MLLGGFLLGADAQQKPTIVVHLYLFFYKKSSYCAGTYGCDAVSYKSFLYSMDQTSLLVTLFFTLVLGAGIGFYVAKLIF
jgi:hypothetical protein